MICSSKLMKVEAIYKFSIVFDRFFLSCENLFRKGIGKVLEKKARGTLITYMSMES